MAAAAFALAGAAGAQAGPVILAGRDAEDGGVGGHGPITTYDALVTTHYNNATNAGTGILVIGGGKPDSGFGPTAFWNQIAADTGLPVTQVNGATNITSQVFVGFRMIAVVSDENNTFAGLTQAENDALTARSGDVAAFVNNGGALLGFSSTFATNPYGYMGTVGGITAIFPPQYSDITATTEGLAAGINDSLDVCCWHDKYSAFPSFLLPLAYEGAETTNPAAIGGKTVIITPAGDKFMTGGGSLRAAGVHHGLVLHCTVSNNPNRLEVNWGTGNKFHLTQMTSAACTDDAAISEGKPVAGFDTHTGSGSGRYNGVDGATAEWVIKDAGEPGKNDTITVTVKDASNAVVLNATGKLDSGNHQAHNG